jgi:hypothetical protein
MVKSEKKQKFEIPKLVVYGTVNNLTHAFGNRSNQDFVFIGGSNVEQGFESLGSRDGVIVPG